MILSLNLDSDVDVKFKMNIQTSASCLSKENEWKATLMFYTFKFYKA